MVTGEYKKEVLQKYIARNMWYNIDEEISATIIIKSLGEQGGSYADKQRIQRQTELCNGKSGDEAGLS